jgi:outer membrane receptor protein involved in Fe transport
LPGYAIFNLRTSWQPCESIELYFEGENIFDHRYASFGLYSDPTGQGAFPNYTDPRFYTPGPPFGFWAGAQVRF